MSAAADNIAFIREAEGQVPSRLVLEIAEESIRLEREAAKVRIERDLLRDLIEEVLRR